MFNVSCLPISLLYFAHRNSLFTFSVYLRAYCVMFPDPAPWLAIVPFLFPPLDFGTIYLHQSGTPRALCLLKRPAKLSFLCFLNRFAWLEALYKCLVYITIYLFFYLLEVEWLLNLPSFCWNGQLQLITQNQINTQLLNGNAYLN